jgi:hypothetical protein
MQLITEERNYRLCALDENSLAMWLGALKSILVKRRELQKENRTREKNGLSTKPP